MSNPHLPIDHGKVNRYATQAYIGRAAGNLAHVSLSRPTSLHTHGDDSTPQPAHSSQESVRRMQCHYRAESAGPSYRLMDLEKGGFFL